MRTQNLPQIANQRNRMVLSLTKLLNYLINLKVSNYCLTCHLSHPLIFISQSENYSPKILNTKFSKTFDTLNLSQRLGFRHSLYEDKFSL